MKPPDDLRDWSKNNLVREVRRLRAVLREHAERPGDDPRPASTADPVVGGSPYGRGDALIDARAAVLLEHVDVSLIDTKRDEPLVMLLALEGRINYSEDRVTHAYLFGPDGGAALVTEIVGLGARASGGDDQAQRFAAELRAGMDRRLAELP